MGTGKHNVLSRKVVHGLEWMPIGNKHMSARNCLANTALIAPLNTGKTLLIIRRNYGRPKRFHSQNSMPIRSHLPTAKHATMPIF
jgi:hypothetical protein